MQFLDRAGEAYVQWTSSDLPRLALLDLDPLQTWAAYIRNAQLLDAFCGRYVRVSRTSSGAILSILSVLPRYRLGRLRATTRVTFWGALSMALTAGIGKLFGTVV